MSPAGMAIASLTVMLWILWADTVRRRPPSPILYTIRVALFLIMSFILLMNMIRYPAMFSGTARMLVIVAAVVGFAGAFYFARKLIKRL